MVSTTVKQVSFCIWFVCLYVCSSSTIVDLKIRSSSGLKLSPDRRKKTHNNRACSGPPTNGTPVPQSFGLLELVDLWIGVNDKVYKIHGRIKGLWVDTKSIWKPGIINLACGILVFFPLKTKRKEIIQLLTESEQSWDRERNHIWGEKIKSKADKGSAGRSKVIATGPFSDSSKDILVFGTDLWQGYHFLYFEVF